MQRLAWDDTYMAMCAILRRRSPDPSTKHGCIFVDGNNRLISIGYNGSPQKCNDEELPWNERPDKYFYVIHSEPNAILNSDNVKRLNGATCYVTGWPCHECIKLMMQVGIKRILYGPVSSKCCDQQDEMITRHILKYYPEVQIEQYPNKISSILTESAQDISHYE